MIFSLLGARLSPCAGSPFTASILPSPTPQHVRHVGGRVAKVIPPLPEEFEGIEDIEARIRSGLWTFDSWEGDIQEGGPLARILMVRPSISGMEGLALDETYGGRCTFLTDEGCGLHPDARPLGCHTLKPDRISGCLNPLDKKETAKIWRDHTEAMEGLLSKLLAEDMAVHKSPPFAGLVSLLSEEETASWVDHIDEVWYQVGSRHQAPTVTDPVQGEDLLLFLGGLLGGLLGSSEDPKG